ncbi:ABC transporter ATP-binding protein [Rhodohalobacter sp. 614A]|uniref:ABC transporter ATP-binding protein n=1 Tax=Rhodohalobacter sp. 614A TaxID=2908649 RepID=UPI001F1A105F|nr:ABC transporter ATP-binding protein [Rhodohalobacter sp. 614A]
MISQSTSNLKISDFSTGYRKKQIIDNLTLPKFEAGNLIAIAGPNAAGKSTFLKALAGHLSATGTVMLDDKNLFDLKFEEWAERVTFMPQKLPDGVGLTVLESVISALKTIPSPKFLNKQKIHEQAMEILEQVGIEGIAMQPLNKISGGQRQLASLAQSLVRDPDLFLLDEPTSALDLRYQTQVMNLLGQLAQKGKIVFVVLHNLSLAARWADQIIIFRDGKLHAFGPPKEAITSEVLAHVYGVKARIEQCSCHQLQIMVDSVI